MIKYFISMIGILSTFFVSAQERYVFQNRDIYLTIEWGIDSTQKDTILLQIKSINDIFIPDQEVCFGFANFNHQVQFGNVCGVMVNGKRMYSIDGLTCCKFLFLHKDSILSYKWRASKGEIPLDFRFDFNYIGSREYVVNKKHKNRQHTTDRRDLVVSSRDIDKFQSVVHLQFPVGRKTLKN